MPLYLSSHTDAEFTHGLCPECLAKLEKDLSEHPSSAGQTEKDIPPDSRLPLA